MSASEEELIGRMKALWAEGRSAAELLRFLDSEGLHTTEMIACFRAAFALEFGDARCIGGWFADGTGELDDKEIQDLLAPEINAKRHEWE